MRIAGDSRWIEACCALDPSVLRTGSALDSHEIRVRFAHDAREIGDEFRDLSPPVPCFSRISRQHAPHDHVRIRTGTHPRNDPTEQRCTTVTPRRRTGRAPRSSAAPPMPRTPLTTPNNRALDVRHGRHRMRHDAAPPALHRRVHARGGPRPAGRWRAHRPRRNLPALRPTLFAPGAQGLDGVELFAVQVERLPKVDVALQVEPILGRRTE